jgi:hypothetical protein
MPCLPPNSRTGGARSQDAVHEPTEGAEELPFFMTVNPKLVDAPPNRPR